MCDYKKMLKYVLIAAGAVITVAGIIGAAVNKNNEDERKGGASVAAIVFGLLCTAAGGIMWLSESFGTNICKAFEDGREKIASVIPERQWDWSDLAGDFFKVKEKTEDCFSKLGGTVTELINNNKNS